MAMRLSKKPISEGFELWDKGYYLGAMRLFIFKAETSPPFQLGACLDAMGHLLARIEEYADAKENFGFAAEKYNTIMQPILAKVMEIKGVEAEEGPEAALPKITALIKEHDADRKAHEATDTKLKTALARAYHLRAKLLFAIDEAKNAGEALADADYAAQIGWDRDHEAHFLRGEISLSAGDKEGAIAAFEKCISRNPNYILAYEALIPALLSQGTPEGRERGLALLTKAIELHPKSALIRQKAFALSENGNDKEALELLDQYIKSPPHEETEALVSLPGAASATFLKAKAAIYADSGDMASAAAAAEEALKHCPGDEEAKKMLADIKASA